MTKTTGRRDDVTGDGTLYTRVNGRRRSSERNYGDVMGNEAVFHHAVL